MRISDWSSDVCSSDLPCPEGKEGEIIVCARKPESERYRVPEEVRKAPQPPPEGRSWKERADIVEEATQATRPNSCSTVGAGGQTGCTTEMRSEEHTSELQSLMRISYAVFCLKKKKKTTIIRKTAYKQTKQHNTKTRRETL